MNRWTTVRVIWLLLKFWGRIFVKKRVNVIQVDRVVGGRWWRWRRWRKSWNNGHRFVVRCHGLLLFHSDLWHLLLLMVLVTVVVMSWRRIVSWMLMLANIIDHIVSRRYLDMIFSVMVCRGFNQDILTELKDNETTRRCRWCWNRCCRCKVGSLSFVVQPGFDFTNILTSSF